MEIDLAPLPEERLWSRHADREVLRADDGYSVRWAEHDFPADVARWNYHPEYELHLIRKSAGRFIVGRTVGSFSAGHVSMVGPGIPHDWVSFIEPGEVVVKRDALVQFDGDWLAQCTALMPELGDLAPLLRRSRQGLVFHGETAIALAEAIEGMGEQSGIDRLYELVGIFRVLARAPEQDVECLDAEYSRLETESRFADAVDVGIDYIFRNLTKVVVLGEAARLAHMSESTFSRYFKRASGLTFTDMVSKLRISHACRLLETTDDPVSAISHAVGFSNLSNFNRAFLRDIGNTPSGYRKTSPRRGLPTSAVSFDPAVMR